MSLRARIPLWVALLSRVILSRVLVAPALAALAGAAGGCMHAPGAPGPESAAQRPAQQQDFADLYRANCSGCHGENGRGGAAIALNDPVYLAVAGQTHLRAAIRDGVGGTLMPAFASGSGGTLTDRQVDALVSGMLASWGGAPPVSPTGLPPYASPGPGDAALGGRAFAQACARCHGADGQGVRTGEGGGAGEGAGLASSIVDPAYLSLVSDQSLRSLVIAGHPQMDWRSYLPDRALTPEEITNIVAWLGQHRGAEPPAAEEEPAAGQAAGHGGRAVVRRKEVR